MSDARDRKAYPSGNRLLSFVTDAINDIDHYIDYRGRSFEDLIAVQKQIDQLTGKINNRLVRDFKPETQKYLQGNHE